MAAAFHGIQVPQKRQNLATLPWPAHACVRAELLSAWDIFLVSSEGREEEGNEGRKESDKIKRVQNLSGGNFATLVEQQPEISRILPLWIRGDLTPRLL